MSSGFHDAEGDDDRLSYVEVEVPQKQRAGILHLEVARGALLSRSKVPFQAPNTPIAQGQHHGGQHCADSPSFHQSPDPFQTVALPKMQTPSGFGYALSRSHTKFLFYISWKILYAVLLYLTSHAAC